MAKVASEKTVLETILEWSEDKPAWQRDALRRIVTKGRLDAQDHQDMIALCKQGRGGNTTALKPIPLEKMHLPANPGHAQAVALISLADVDGANNLAPKQTVSFGPNGITIIYGDNGSGKSGYARILKRACRARHPGKIEANIYAEEAPPEHATATITYSIGGQVQSPEKWKDGQHPHPILSAVSVFDSDSAAVHIKGKNEVAFRPFGLDVPDELASVCQVVKEALSAEQGKLERGQNPIFMKPSWKETTAVGKALSALKYDTDVETIKALGILTGEQTIRLGRLRQDLAKDPAKAAVEQLLKADNIKRLTEAVTVLSINTNDAAFESVASATAEAVTRRKTAQLAAHKAFSGEVLKGVGGEVWRLMWEAAKRYSTEIAYAGQTFPPLEVAAHCVLCHQTLDAGARDRMARFEDFIQKDTEQQAQEAEKASTLARGRVAALVINTRSLKASLEEVGLHNIDLAQRTRRFIASCRRRRHELLKALDVGKEVVLSDVTANPITDLMELEKGIRQYAAELQKSAKPEEREKLETEVAELSDRTMLAGMMDRISDEINRLKAIHFLGECLDDTTTTKITNMGNEIADTVITPKLRDRFQKEIVKLAAEKVRVEIFRAGGRYGSPEYQIRLFAKPDAKVHDILSEGEKTCVALAAFLTELATATHHSALVFDDPVTSLDHRWRKQVAKRLVDEAENRQIVIFTHDLIFVNDLDDLAEREKRPVRLMTVSRGKGGAGIVSDGLPWKGKRVEDRIDKLEKDVRAAEKLYNDNKEDEYNKDAADVYSRLRASWERAIEEIAFSRVVLRHRDYIDPTTLKKVTVLTDRDCDDFHAGYKKCCDITDAHDPSGGRNASAPPPKEILADIKALKDWVLSLRDRQKPFA